METRREILRLPSHNPTRKTRRIWTFFDYEASSHGPVLVDGIGWIDCQIVERADFGGDHGLIIGQAQRAWFNPEFLNPVGVPHAETNPLMQVTGNRFATATQLQRVPYY